MCYEALISLHNNMLTFNDIIFLSMRIQLAVSIIIHMHNLFSRIECRFMTLTFYEASLFISMLHVWLK